MGVKILLLLLLKGDMRGEARLGQKLVGVPGKNSTFSLSKGCLGFKKVAQSLELI